jgi:hypothetical protein
MASPTKLTSKIAAAIICILLSFGFVSTVLAQSSGVTLKAQASATQLQVGSTLTVTMQLLNAQNIASLDFTLNWNSSVLTLAQVTLNLGMEIHSNGVLHGNQLNYDFDSVSSGDIYVEETKLSGSYELLAQSIGQSNPGFSGSGTIATLTFNVTNSGSAGLAIENAVLADHPAAGGNANLVTPSAAVDSVTAYVIPEFPSAVMLVLIFGLTTAAMLFAKKPLKKK